MSKPADHTPWMPFSPVVDFRDIVQVRIAKETLRINRNQFAVWNEDGTLRVFCGHGSQRRPPDLNYEVTPEEKVLLYGVVHCADAWMSFLQGCPDEILNDKYEQGD